MSTDEAKINLARRAVACPRWRWMVANRIRGPRGRIGGRAVTARELADAVELLGHATTARAAVHKWGPADQLRQVQEECAELIAAINRTMRGRGEANMIEEVGQVWLLLLQLREIIGHDAFAASVNAAARKTIERMEAAP